MLSSFILSTSVNTSHVHGHVDILTLKTPQLYDKWGIKKGDVPTPLKIFDFTTIAHVLITEWKLLLKCENMKNIYIKTVIKGQRKAWARNVDQCIKEGGEDIPKMAEFQYSRCGWQSHDHPRKQDVHMSTQCCCDVAPPSATLPKHFNHIGPTSRMSAIGQWRAASASAGAAYYYQGIYNYIFLAIIVQVIVGFGLVDVVWYLGQQLWP